MSSIEAIKNKLQGMAPYWSTLPDSLTEKVEELKNDPQFASWSEEDLTEYAATLLAKGNAQGIRAFMNSINYRSGKPLNPDWAEYSFEEILEMEDNGVLIPEDVLEWAHSMQASNVAEYELDNGDVNNINDTDTTRADVGESGNRGLTNVAKVFSKKVVLQEEALKDAVQEFEQYSGEMESMTNEALTVQNNALKEIQKMMNEWQSIDDKVKKGEELTSEEQARYGELGALMNNVVSNSTMQIANFTSDFDNVAKLMNKSSKEAKIAQDYAEDTSFTGSLIAEYESSKDAKAAAGNKHIFDGAMGVVDLIRSNALGKNLAVTSIKQSGYLQTETFNTDRSIKEVSTQMESMTDKVNSGEKGIADVISDGASEKASSSAQIGKPEAVEDTPPEPSDEEITMTPVGLEPSGEDDENKNVFAEDEDFNDIESILKRSRKQPPKVQPQDIIIES